LAEKARRVSLRLALKMGHLRSCKDELEKWYYCCRGRPIPKGEEQEEFTGEVQSVANRFKSKAEPKERPEKRLAKVPEDQVFRCYDGRIFRDMRELAEGLGAMSFDTFVYHVNLAKNDFSNWLRDVVKDEKLASDMENVTHRAEAAKLVAARVTALTKMSARAGASRATTGR
jgi:hypothetical protein